ncbi:MAG: endonuclease [Chlorobi bacterium]|nr:endonuclease [Chlorobiota bacterium]
MKDRKINRINFSTLLLLLPLFTTIAQTTRQSDSYNLTVFFYNTENLFDCKDDSAKADEEFLPESKRKWNYYRYKNKINKTAKVILASNGWHPPVLAGICETENKKVLNKLIWDTGLSETGYRFVHFESPDKRGIDVALLYLHDKFKIIKSYPVSSSIPEKNFYTRDILYVQGIAFGSDTINVLVCHLPSKYGGELSSEWKRMYVATRIRKICDSLFTNNLRSNIIILGDMNDTPLSKPVQKIIYSGTGIPEYNLISPALKTPEDAPGTIKYHGYWQVIDQIIISKALNQPPFKCEEKTIVNLPFLLEPDITYSGLKPFRTFSGPAYHNGFSDHLPVKATIKKLSTSPAIPDK